MKQKMTRREDYLKLIYSLSKKGEVHGADLADELNVKRPTVCIYLKQLVENGDIEYAEQATVDYALQLCYTS
jgi:Mn-dependent DtxR family transcriptional regulator